MVYCLHRAWQFRIRRSLDSHWLQWEFLTETLVGARAEGRHTSTFRLSLATLDSQTSKRAGKHRSQSGWPRTPSSFSHFLPLFTLNLSEQHKSVHWPLRPEIAVSTPLPWPILPQLLWLASPKAPPPRTPATLLLSPSYTRPCFPLSLLLPSSQPPSSFFAEY